MNRYSRQICLPEIGEDGQRKLSSASVLCIGAGGLGAPALLYLAAAGVWRIGIIDFDRVDKTNLQRQVLYTEQDVGQPKAEAAARRLKALNLEIIIESYTQELNVETANHLFPLYDIILDGTDNFETKYLINDAAVKYGKPWIYGAIQRFDGQASVFDAAHGPCYRCLFPHPPKAQIMNCAEAGVIGAVAGLVGVTQAMQVIQMITGSAAFEPLIGKLWTVDMRTMQTHTLALSKNSQCPACSISAEAVKLSYVSPQCAAHSEVSVAQVKGMKNLYLIDVREKEEWDTGHIEGAHHWPLSRMVNGELPELPANQEIVFYCQRGQRSMKALTLIVALSGVKNTSPIFSMQAGYEGWTSP